MCNNKNAERIYFFIMILYSLLAYFVHIQSYNKTEYQMWLRTWGEMQRRCCTIIIYLWQTKGNLKSSGDRTSLVRICQQLWLIRWPVKSIITCAQCRLHGFKLVKPKVIDFNPDKAWSMILWMFLDSGQNCWYSNAFIGVGWSTHRNV